jgi:hypothetical protein
MFFAMNEYLAINLMVFYNFYPRIDDGFIILLSYHVLLTNANNSNYPQQFRNGGGIAVKIV